MSLLWLKIHIPAVVFQRSWKVVGFGSFVLRGFRCVLGPRKMLDVQHSEHQGELRESEAFMTSDGLKPNWRGYWTAEHK